MAEAVLEVWDLELLASADGIGAVWSFAGDDMNLNIMSFPADRAVGEHVNSHVDVLGIVLRGDMWLVVDGHEQRVRRGQAFYISRGASRALRPGSDGVTYLSCHRRRGGLQIQPLRGQETS